MKPEFPDKRRIGLAMLIPVLPALALIALTIRLHTISYDDLLQGILDSLQRPDLASRLRNEYFTPSKFALGRTVVMLLTVFAVLVAGVFWFYRVAYTQWCVSAWQVIPRSMQSFRRLHSPFSGRWRWVWPGLFLLAGIRFVYYSMQFDLQYDEMWNANLFLRHHAWTSLFAYNNYPLHNVLLGLLTEFFGDGAFILRLPSVLFGLATMMSMVVLVHHFYPDRLVALAIAIVFACLPVSIFYMLYARGVMLELFFVTWISALLIDSMNREMSRRKAGLLCILNALATLSMLSHVVFIIGSGLALLVAAIVKRSGYTAIWNTVLYSLGSMALSALAFLPMMMGTGLSPLRRAATGGLGIDLYHCLHYIEDCSIFLTGFRYSLWICLIGYIIMLLTSLRRAPLAWHMALLACCLLLSVAAAVCGGSLPPERAFSFLFLLPLGLTGMVIAFVQQRFKQALPVMLAALVFALVLSIRGHTHPFLNWSKQLDHEVKQAAKELQRANIRSVYNDNRDFDYFIPGVDYYSHRKGKGITFSSSSRASTRYGAVPGIETQAVVVTPVDRYKYPGFTTTIYSYGDILVLGKTN